MAADVVIDERFNGPPGSANGGYASALAAGLLDGPAEVTLRSPPPLGTALRAERRDETVTLHDGEVLVAEARPATVEVEVPEAVSIDEAARAAEGYPWREVHPYPTCFVCGPRRDTGDGLAIFPGPIDDGSRYAAPWTPELRLAGDDGHVRDPFVWAALDCPGGIVTDLLGEVGRILLGRLTADLRAPVRAGDAHVVQAWPIGRDGRKLHTGTALFDADGGVLAVARAVWIDVEPPA